MGCQVVVFANPSHPLGKEYDNGTRELSGVRRFCISGCVILSSLWASAVGEFSNSKASPKFCRTQH
jgi:hypothetical protein